MEFIQRIESVCCSLIRCTGRDSPLQVFLDRVRAREHIQDFGLSDASGCSEGGTVTTKPAGAIGRPLDSDIRGDVASTQVVFERLTRTSLQFLFILYVVPYSTLLLGCP